MKPYVVVQSTPNCSSDIIWPPSDMGSEDVGTSVGVTLAQESDSIESDPDWFFDSQSQILSIHCSKAGEGN